MNKQWEDGMGVPYDGWYNGNAKLMIGNGTYGYYRTYLLQKAEKGKLYNVGSKEKRVEESMRKLSEWDSEWDAIPQEEKDRRMQKVIADVTPRMVTRHTVKGPIQVVWSVPSENNNMAPRNEKGGKPKLKKLRPPSGSIAASVFANPLAATPA